MILKRVSASDGGMFDGAGGGFFAWEGIPAAQIDRIQEKKKRSSNGRSDIVMKIGEGVLISCSSCYLDGFTSEFHFMFCAAGPLSTMRIKHKRES